MKKRLRLAFTITVAAIFAVLILMVFHSDLRSYLQEYQPYLFLFLLISGLILRLPYQISVGTGIMLLLITPLSLNRGEELTSQIAICAFYFLCVGLIWGVVDYIGLYDRILKWRIRGE
jgi:beta-lactamase regulating signal transducer with metallopeptidase domain